MEKLSRIGAEKSLYLNNLLGGIEILEIINRLWIAEQYWSTETARFSSRRGMKAAILTPFVHDERKAGRCITWIYTEGFALPVRVNVKSGVW